MLDNIIKVNALLTETIAGTWYSTYQLSCKYSPNPNISFDVRSAFCSVFTNRNKPRCINSSYNTKKKRRSAYPLSFNSTAQTDAFEATPTSAQNSSPYVHEKSILAPVISAEFQSRPPGGVF